MTVLSIIKKLLGLFVVSGIGALLFSLVVNIIIAAGLIPDQASDTSFGYIMTERAVIVWLGCVAAAIGSLFMSHWIRWILFFSPLIGPSAFALIYAFNASMG